MTRFVRPLALATLLLCALAGAGSASQGQGTLAGPDHTRALKELQQRHLLQTPMRRAAKQRALEATRRAITRGQKIRETRDLTGKADAVRTNRDEAPFRISAIAPNYIANNRAGDVVAGSTQAEVSIAAHGTNVLAAWNDAEGFATATSTQGYAYSTDGGVTWTDGGVPPTTNVGKWTSDPIVGVNEKTGEFYFSALCDPTGTTNGVGVVKGTFSGANFNWQTPMLVRTIPNNGGTNILDKNWFAVDSLSGYLYVTYTHFEFGSDKIEFQRWNPTTQVWSAATQVSSVADDGAVHGSRPVVGPSGELYVIWHTIDFAGLTGADLLEIKKSTNNGQGFSGEVTAASLFTNFGSGAPGFNRGVGVTFPAIAVDRSTAPNRGRVYVTWNESINFYDDNLGTTGNTNEAEPNNITGQATLFTLGRQLTGTISSGADVDFFRFAGVQGQTVILYMDPPGLNDNLDCDFHIFCTDQNTRLAYSRTGTGPNSAGLLVFTIPANGNYYVRCRPNSGTGGYTIQTGIDNGVANRSRDHRDLFVAYSDNGTTWANPVVRVNDDLGRLDNWLPEVAVGGNGKPYVFAYDFRDASSVTCGGQSNTYLWRSDTGGATWTQGSPVADVLTDWTFVNFNAAPNQGDYIGLFANTQYVYMGWADGRFSDSDVMVAKADLGYTSTGASLVSALAEPDRVELVWHAGSPSVLATVYRREADGPWVALATRSPDGSGLIRYEDHDVIAGSRYAYRLGIPDGQGAEQFTSETWIDVPRTAPLELSIAGIRPNPTPREIWVDFLLTSDASATLELLDVSGRRVASQDVGARGPGRHLVRLDPGAGTKAGVYVVRLSQQGRVVSGRVSVVR